MTPDIQSTTTVPPTPVLVTGAGGFIGTHLIRRFLDRRDQVYCLVRHPNAIDASGPSGPQAIFGDVTVRGEVDRALAESNPATVFHLAGLVRARNPPEFMRVNRDGVDVVAAACGTPHPPVLVVVSSLAAAGPCAADHPRTETDTPAPISEYGRSKLAGETAAARYAARVPITIVRPPIVFGPGDLAVLEVFRSIARHGLHVVPSRHGGTRRVSLVYVDDLIEGLLLAAARGERLQPSDPPGRGVYFMAGSEHPTYADLGRHIAAALGRKPPTVLRIPAPLLRLFGVGGDLISLARGRPTWINSDKMREALATGSWICSSAKASEHLGWTPAPTAALSQQLHATAEWYRSACWI